MTKVTIALSRKISDNNYGSFEATVGLEDEVPEGTSRESFAAATRAWCKAFLDETLGDMRQEYLSTSPIEKPYVDINAALSEAEGGAQPVEAYQYAGEIEYAPQGEVEAQPFEAVKAAVQQTAQQMETPPQETRTALPEGHKTFTVDHFKVARTDGGRGDIYLQVWGDGPWSRDWVPAWKKEAELLFADLESFDLGVLRPPYDLEATVLMGEYKIPESGKVVPSPQHVIEWARIG